MSNQKSPYKEVGINISKTLGHELKHPDGCKCKKCCPKLWEILESGKAPGAIGYKTGGKW